MLSAVALPASPGATDRVTLLGKVNDNFQIVAGNETYEVKNNAAGDDLVINYVSKKVRVVGHVSETRKFKIKVITVESFEVIEDDN
jgi:hypothetical protein